MSVILDFSTGTDNPPGVPLIGWHNVVTGGSITSSSEAPGFPASNLENPSTHLKWKGMVGAVSLLHFEISGSSPDIVVDSAINPNAWTAVGNTFMDTSQFKFGSRSVRFDGTGDWITGANVFAFGSDDFTVEFFVRLNSTAATTVFMDWRGVSPAPVLYKLSGSAPVKFYDGTADRITGTTNLTTGVWYHIALTRSSGSTRLYVDGVQEGSTYTDTNVYNSGTNRPLIGGDAGSANLDGWMEELRIIQGYAVSSLATFPVPTSAYTDAWNEYVTVATNTADTFNYFAVARHNFGTSGSLVSLETNTGSSPDTWVELITQQYIPDDAPLIFRFAATTAAQVRLRIQSAGVSPEAAVIYVGTILVMEKGIKAEVDHTPLTFGRQTRVVNGMSETGNFLGRILLSETRRSTAEFHGITPTFYRSSIEDFLDAAQEVPFFWAWAPEEYPLETGYAWLMDDTVPEITPSHRHVSLKLEMRGVA